MAKNSQSGVHVKKLGKRYGGQAALTDVSFDLKPGNFYGLIGHNGAGKTTTLRALLGLIPYQGQVSVFGLEPFKHRQKLMQRVAFISDVASLPPYLRLSQLIDFLTGTHPSFSAQTAKTMLNELQLDMSARLGTLSKGQLTQTHLAMVLATDYDFLVLDEPTIGLDIVVRKAFYRKIQRDNQGSNRIVLVTTHQVDEVAFLLSHALFLKQGELVLNSAMDALETTYWQLTCTFDKKPRAQTLQPIYSYDLADKHIAVYDNPWRDKAVKLGTVSHPDLSELFVALMGKDLMTGQTGKGILFDPSHSAQPQQTGASGQ